MLQLKIVTPEQLGYEGEAESIVVPGTLGDFEILTGHAPIISSLEKGDIVYVTKEGRQTLAIRGGFVAVEKDVVNICVEI